MSDGAVGMRAVGTGVLEAGTLASRRMGGLWRRGCAVTLLALAAWAGVGCEDRDNGDGDGGFTGTWALYSGTKVAGTPYWYVHINPDKTFFISDHRDGSRVRVRGTYTVDGGKLTGPFVNPGTGNGRIEATRDGSLLRLLFIEYWHTPNKVIPYTGSRT